MTDDLAGLLEGDASGQPAAYGQADIERLVAEAVAKSTTDIAAKFEERARGFQRLLAGRDQTVAALERQNRELKIAGLSEDEREQFQVQELRQRNEELERRLEIQNLRGEFGSDVDLYEQLLQAPDARTQIELLRGLRAPQAPSAPAAPEAPAVPEVDHNNPARTVPADAFVLPNGQAMTEDIADRILRSVTRQSDLTQR